MRRGADWCSGPAEAGTTYGDGPRRPAQPWYVVPASAGPEHGELPQLFWQVLSMRSDYSPRAFWSGTPSRSGRRGKPRRSMPKGHFLLPVAHQPRKTRGARWCATLPRVVNETGTRRFRAVWIDFGQGSEYS